MEGRCLTEALNYLTELLRNASFRAILLESRGEVGVLLAMGAFPKSEHPVLYYLDV